MGGRAVSLEIGTMRVQNDAFFRRRLHTNNVLLLSACRAIPSDPAQAAEGLVCEASSAGGCQVSFDHLLCF